MQKVIKRILIGFFVILTVMTITSYILVLSTGNRLAELRQAITEKGDYLLITDYPLPTPSDERNAFIYLQQTANLVEALDREIDQENLSDAYRWLNGESINEARLSKVEAILSKYTDLYAELVKASKCEGFRSEFNPEQGFAAELPHLAQTRSACRVLALKALVDGKKGRGDSAMQSCEAMIRLGKFMDSEPILIGHLVGVACMSTALSTANHINTIAPISDESIDRFLSLLDSLDTHRGLADALKGERAIAVMTFQQLREGKLADWDGDAMPKASKFGNPWLTEAYLNDDEAKYLSLMSRQMRWIDEPQAIRTPQITSVINELEESSFRFMLSKMVLPSIAEVANARDRIEAEIRCFRLMLTSKRTGSRPIDTMEFPTPQKMDPFTHKPLKIKELSGGWLIYSVGENLTDDGGAIWKTEETLRPLDIGFSSIVRK